MLKTFTGTLTDWTLFDANRKYGTIQNMPYLEAKELIVAVGYNGQTNKGQQRALVQAHINKLRKEMEAQTFTPTPISAAMEPRHLKNLTINKDGTFSLTVDSREPLLHTDGGHRFAALGAVIASLENLILDRKASAEDKDKYARWLEQAKAVPFTVTVYFDGDPARDFINLQAGRTVDKSHMLSLKLHSKVNGDPACGLAMDVARALHKLEGSPFHNNIKFDSRGSLPLPISTLCSRGASDLGTSLLGLAKVGENKEARFLANAVVAAFNALQADDEKDRNAGRDGILEWGKVLTPIASSGTKGSSTMLTGVGMCLAYRLVQQGRDEASPEDLAQLIDAAKETLDTVVAGSFSGPDKRAFLGRFAKEFFSDIECPKHCGIPVGLLTTLSCSTFGVPALPKVPKPTKTPKAPKAKGKSQKSKSESAVSGPVPAEAAPAQAPAAESVAAADAGVHGGLGTAESVPLGTRASRVPGDAGEVSTVAAPLAVEPRAQPCGQGVDANPVLLTKADVDA